MSTEPKVRILSHEGWTSPSTAWRPAVAWYLAMAVLHLAYYLREPVRSISDVLGALMAALLMGLFGFVGYFATVELVKWDKERSPLAIHAIVPFMTAALEVFCLFVVPMLFAFLARLVTGTP